MEGIKEELTPSMEETFDDFLNLSDSSFLETCESLEMDVFGGAQSFDDFMDMSDTSFLEDCESFENKIKTLEQYDASFGRKENMDEKNKEHTQILLTEEELINAMDLSGNMEIGQEEGKEEKGATKIKEEKENAGNAESANQTINDLEEIDLRTVTSGERSIEIFMKTLEDMVLKDKKVNRLFLEY